VAWAKPSLLDALDAAAAVKVWPAGERDTPEVRVRSSAASFAADGRRRPSGDASKTGAEHDATLLPREPPMRGTSSQGVAVFRGAAGSHTDNHPRDEA
jgi:hypothetical protein